MDVGESNMASDCGLPRGMGRRLPMKSVVTVAVIDVAVGVGVMQSV